MGRRAKSLEAAATFRSWDVGRNDAVSLCLCLVVCFGFVVGCSGRDTAPAEIRIGFLFDEPSSIARVTREAADLAVAAINAAGGIEVDGRAHKVVMVVGDTDNTPEGATRASLELINREQVVAIVGSSFSRNAIPAGGVAEQAGIPMICPGSSNQQTTLDRNFVFRVTFVDAFQGRVMARFARSELGLATAAVLYDVADTYSRDIAMVFSQDFEDSGGEVLAFEAFTTGDQDFVPALERIRETEVEVLFLPNFRVEVVLQAQQARALGIDAVLLGGDGWPSEKLKIPEELEGAFFSLAWHHAMASVNLEAAEFIESYQDTFGMAPEDLAAMTYDAFGLLFDAVATASSVDPMDIRDALAQTEGYRGVTGPITFRGTDGDPRRSAAIVQIRDQSVHLFKTVDAELTP